ncbi:MAG TPA: hypothetical protein VHE34_04945 [Puia sp.]|uniref:hypothetical protein n=1 Tax=Puia sp. TaxID=2045100 RepID=UPI002BBF0D63|nr:hypothetical protein [Puia sp.]HVU94546.1 hypothetical protein [Puia sp.]
MKASNKWLLGFILATVLFCLGMYGLLYSEYRKGHFVTEAQLHKEQFIKQPIRKPRVIALDGTVWVNLVPADSFSLELPRVNKDADAGLFQTGPAIQLKINSPETPAVTWRQQGDTLFIKGSVNRPLHRPWSAWYYRRAIPEVNVLGPDVDEIILNNGQLYLQGTAAATAKRSARLTIRNSTLWLGMQYDNDHRGPTEFFDSLDIHSANSITIINRAAVINHLRMTETDSSVVSDQYANIQSSIIQSSPDSRVDLSGGNLKNNQLIIR